MSAQQDTLPKLLLRQTERYGDRRPALREKNLGIWREITWRQYHDRVKHFCLGLIALGLQRGDKVSIIGDNRPEWQIAELAAQSAGGASVGLYQDSSPREFAYIIDHSDSKFVVVEDQEQVDKVLEIKEALPKAQKLIYWEAKGMRHYHDPLLMRFDAVEQLGRDFEQREPGRFEAEVAKGAGDDLAMIAYTSGTTGAPKGAMLSHRNFISAIHNLFLVEPMKEYFETVSYLPPAWVGDRAWSTAGALVLGCIVNFPEEPETVQQNIREIGPHFMVAAPRIWENILSTVQVKIQDASGLKRGLYDRFLPYGYKAADARLSGQSLALGDRVMRWLGEQLVFRPIRNQLGMLRVRLAYNGGAALGPDIIRFYRAMGINLKQVYGQTEIAGVSTVHPDNQVKFETVGKPIPETELRITDSGEVASRSPAVFLGYYKNPEATAATIRDGWLYSGDHGLIDEDGHLVVIDRMKDVMATADGVKFAPQYIENKLKFSPYIKEAVVFGDGRPYITAFVNIDMENVGKWAEKHGLAYTTYVDLSQKREVYDLVLEHVRRVNRELPKATNVKRFVILHKELDPDDEEITRTRKVRRGFVAQRYSYLTEGLYGDAPAVQVSADVKYQDGRQVRIQTTVRVMAVEEESLAGVEARR